MFANLKAKALGLLVAVFAVGSAHAVPITYEFWGTASGHLGSDSFVDTQFRITAYADTDAIQSRSYGYRVVDTSASVWVEGLGEAAFTIQTTNVDNQQLGSVGFSSPLDNRAILFISGPAFSTYDLSSSIGPITGPAIFNSGFDFGTTLGNFAFTAVERATFQASVTPVPEPSTYALLGIGLLAVAVGAKRRKTEGA